MRCLPVLRQALQGRAAGGLGAGIAVRANLRAFVIYLRSVQGIPLARLSHVLRDLFGLDISEGALVNILDASREPFAMQTSLIKARLLAGTALASDETGMRVGRAIGGSGCSITPTVPSSSRQTPLQGGCACVLAIGARITGFRTAMAARWAGQRASIRSASRISSATSNTRSTLATRCSRPA